MSPRDAIRAAVGNLATASWFFPSLAKAIHRWRGVQMPAPRSVFIGRNVVIDNRCPELVSVGRDVWLTQGVIVLAHSHCSQLQRTVHGMTETRAPVVIEDGVFVGAGSIVLPGVRLGRGCYIGAGSVVNRDIAAGMLAVGNPCREVRPLEPARCDSQFAQQPGNAR